MYDDKPNTGIGKQRTQNLIDDEPGRPMMMSDEGQQIYSPDLRKKHDLYSDNNMASPSNKSNIFTDQKMNKTGALPPRSPNKYSKQQYS